MTTDTFLQNRLTRLEALIEAYDAATLAIVSGASQEYELDTGQTRMRVTKFNVSQIQSTVDRLMTTRHIYRVRLGLESSHSVQVARGSIVFDE